MSEKKLLSMVIGGASSGKSSFAEALVMSLPGPHYYLATAQAYDDEMDDKIRQHQRERQGAGWITIEAPVDLEAAISTIPSTAHVLLDCATMWLNNLFMADGDIPEATDRLVEFLAQQPRSITIVTNEVGLGIVPENKMARQFRISQGALNAALAARCDQVFCVMAGLPFALKGKLP